MIPVLAAGVVGTCLGATVTALWSRGRPVVPLAEACARETIAAALVIAAAEEVGVARGLVDEAHDAMKVLAQRLADERHARGAAEMRAAAAEERVDALEMGLGEAA